MKQIELFSKHAIHVTDREGDAYDVLETLIQGTARFVIRSKSNRRLRRDGALLEDALKEAPLLGAVEVKIPARSGKSARGAIVYLRTCRVTVRPPEQHLLGHHPDLTLNVIEAWEERPPQGAAPLHWRLWTSEPIDTVADCETVLEFYARRWIVEEFHKALKSGRRLEERRLESAKRFGVFLALASVISCMLLQLRHAARQDNEQDALTYFSPMQLALLKARYPRPIGRRPTIRNALRAVGQMRGFLGRKGDGDPGWITLSRGLKELLLAEQAMRTIKSFVRLRRALPTYGS